MSNISNYNTKNQVGSRLMDIVKYLGMTPNEFSKSIGFERADKIYNILNGKFYPSYEVLEAITNKYVDINLNWLVNNQGGMIKDTKPISSTLTQERPPPDAATGQLIDKICQLSEHNAKLQVEYDAMKSRVEALARELDIKDPYQGKLKYKEAQHRESMAAEPKLKKK